MQSQSIRDKKCNLSLYLTHAGEWAIKAYCGDVQIGIGIGGFFCKLLLKIFVHNTKMLHSVQVANSVMASVIVQYIPHFLNDLTSQGRKATFFWKIRASELRKRKSATEKKHPISFKACTAQT